MVWLLVIYIQREEQGGLERGQTGPSEMELIVRGNTVSGNHLTNLLQSMPHLSATGQSKRAPTMKPPSLHCIATFLYSLIPEVRIFK